MVSCTGSSSWTCSVDNDSKLPLQWGQRDQVTRFWRMEYVLIQYKSLPYAALSNVLSVSRALSSLAMASLEHQFIYGKLGFTDAYCRMGVGCLHHNGFCINKLVCKLLVWEACFVTAMYLIRADRYSIFTFVSLVIQKT